MTMPATPAPATPALAQAPGAAVAPGLAGSARACIRAGLGRRWAEALAWGFGAFLAAGVPGIYFWLIVGAAIVDWLNAAIGGQPITQDWSALAVHLPFAIGTGIVSWLVAAGVCFAVARGRRLCATPMLAIGWLAFVAPFAIWLAFIRPLA